MKNKIKAFILDFVKVYLESVKGETYKDKPITAINSKVCGLTNSINAVFKTELTGLEVYEDYIKPLAEDGKLFTSPCKRNASGQSNGYMISLTPFKRTATISAKTAEVLANLAKQYAK